MLVSNTLIKLTTARQVRANLKFQVKVILTKQTTKQQQQQQQQHVFTLSQCVTLT